MKTQIKVKSLVERKMENPAYRKRFQEAYERLKLEVQILNALEKKGWTYQDLARALQTAKGNISRDLRQGGINHATVDRIRRIADKLDMEFLPLFVPREKMKEVRTHIQELLTA